MKNPPMPPMPPMPAGPASAGLPPAGPLPTDQMTEGEVVLNIPKSTFDQIHGTLKELFGMLDQFKSGIDAEENAAMTEMNAETEMAAGDEADLAAFAQELSSRAKV
jgi:hypothetical protein